MSSATVGDVDGHYVLSFEADADGVLSTEVEKLTQMISYPAVLIDMVVSPGLVLQFSTKAG